MVEVILQGEKTPENQCSKRIKSLLNNNPKPTKNVLQKGDIVRLARVKSHIFESSLRQWTNETFIVDKIYITDPVTYVLNDLKGEEIKGIFFHKALQKMHEFANLE